ncbi:MAG TPA: phosphoribosyltransferase [Syntrophomonadaceae bacterium]|nr:phosphoribosyltransferase [Syntrophomonadaceae bacterium]
MQGVINLFQDRQTAGRQLAEKLLKYQGKDLLVLGVPRGGVIVAAEVAKALAAPLDVIISRKIGAPFNPELALGAVAPDGTVLYDERLMNLLGLGRGDLQEQVSRQLEEIRRRQKLYRGEREPLSYSGRTVIVVDDGIATGFTLRAALRSISRHGPGKLVLAVPVAPPEVVDKFRHEVDEVVCLETPEEFYAVGQFYKDFRQTSDEEVVAALVHNWRHPESQ